MEEQAKPFVKIAGGKRGLLWRLTELAPKTIATYWEPFVGGGALFWNLANAGRFRRAVISDANEVLVRTYIAVQRNHVGVLRELAKHKHNRRHFEAVRAQDPRKLSDERAAAWMIFLNRAGFNGLYRVNASGVFNVPFGKQAKMTIFIDPQVLKNCAKVMNDRKVTIICGDFEDVTREVRLGDFVYADSPYHPISKTSSFTGYQAGGFKESDQERLAKLFHRLDRGGISAVFSNSFCDLTERLYSGHIETIMAKRSINSVGAGRGEIKEIIAKTRAVMDAVPR